MERVILFSSAHTEGVKNNPVTPTSKSVIKKGVIEIRSISLYLKKMKLIPNIEKFDQNI
jgi:hypothetical protein